MISNQGKLNVLVVDGHVDAASSLVELLQLWQFDARFVSSGEDALACLRERVPDVILVELELPDMDGCALVRALRDRSLPAVPVFLAVTACCQESDRRRASEAGMLLHLPKPVDLHRLRTTLSSIAAFPLWLREIAAAKTAQQRQGSRRSMIASTI